MKRIVQIWLGMMVVLVLLVACRDNRPGEDYNRQVTIRPSDTTIAGYLQPVLSIVDKSAELTYSADNYISEGKVTIAIRSLKKGDPQDADLTDGQSGPLYLTMCDSTGKPILGFEDFISDPEGDKMLKHLMAHPGAVQKVPFYLFLDKGKKLPDEVHSFVVYSKKQEQRYLTDTIERYRPDWDDIIELFSEQVEEYHTTVKLAAKGDTAAWKQYPDHIRTVRGSEEVLVQARFNHQLTERQIKKVIKIQDRLLEVEMKRVEIDQ